MPSFVLAAFIAQAVQVPVVQWLLRTRIAIGGPVYECAAK
jgi:hypothetical protein